MVFLLMFSTCDFIPESHIPKWLQDPAIVLVSQAGGRTEAKWQLPEMPLSPTISAELQPVQNSSPQPEAADATFWPGG